MKPSLLLALPLLASLLVAQKPGTVTDLTAIAATDSAITLTWSEVTSGLSTPASYSIRYGPANNFAWWLLPDGAQVTGTIATPSGQKLTRVIRGLTPSTAYSFQLVPYTGTLGTVAIFGGLSNVVSFATAATPPIKPPPPPPPVVTLSKQLVVWPATLIPTAGAQVTLYTIYRDTTGTVSPGIHANWTSSNPLIATVDSFGRVVTLKPGIDTITATANGLSAKSIFDVRAWSSTPLTVLGMSIPSGQYDFYPTDSTGKKTAHITIWVLTP